MNASTTRLAAILGPVLTLCGVASAGDGYPEVSPFSAVRWKDPTPEVQVNEVWYELLELDGVPTREIILFAKGYGRDKWRQRFEEDLAELLGKMERPVRLQVKLKLKRLDTGETVTLENVPMTPENRRALWEARRTREGEPPLPARRVAAPRRVQRQHAAEPKEAFKHLLRRFESSPEQAAILLTRAQAEQDLDELEWDLVHRFSYAKLKGVGVQAALDAVRLGLGDGIDRGALALQLMKVLALFGDGHSQLRESPQALFPPGNTPFLVGDCPEGVVAFGEDRSDFLDPGHPILVSLDGIEIDRWLAAAAGISTGSPQHARRHALRTLRYVNYLRQELGIARKDRLLVVLRSLDGKSTKTLDLPLAQRTPADGEWPTGASRRLPGDIGYLRIESMEEGTAFIRSLHEAMAGFRDTKGLVIDVRGNGGGSRDAVRELFPYFMTDKDSPRVANVAAYRLAEGERPDAPEGYLQDRFLYPLSSKQWTPNERKAIEQLAQAFKPEWQPPAGEFSAWHYFVISPKVAGQGAAPPEHHYHYERPVVVLLNGDCFSATDIFLGTFKGWRNVTLIGTPSGGGSGRAMPLTLRNSAIALRLSSMASFQRDGRLYDGRGVEPDVVVQPAPTDFLNKSDSVLDAALKRLKQ